MELSSALQLLRHGLQCLPWLITGVLSGVQCVVASCGLSGLDPVRVCSFHLLGTSALTVAKGFGVAELVLSTSVSCEIS